MRVSGFSFCRNDVRLYYPIAESIRSALPLVDEYVIAGLRASWAGWNKSSLAGDWANTGTTRW
jgi:hypothetical protein